MSDPKSIPPEVLLRPYQRDAIARLDEILARAVRRVCLVAPCGAGKTTICASIIRACVVRGERVLFLAHRRELISQAYNRLLAVGLDEADVGVIMASDARRRPAARVQVASVDTLRHRAKPAAEVVFVDEAHRAIARSYRVIADAYPHAIHLGLTATPYRGDGRGLADAYDELLVVATPRELIDGGWLVEPRVLTIPASARPDLSRVAVRGGDYDERALGDAVDRPTLVGSIVDHWLRHANGVRTVVFAVSVAHSRHIVERFVEAGVAAEHLDGTTPVVARDAILTRLDRGEISVVSNCGVLCEGWDQPSVKCAILARPTRSPGLYLQQAGRILRPWNGVGAIVLDHGGCALDHGLPHADQEFSLDGCKKEALDEKRRAGLPTACPACCTVIARASPMCPSCGAAMRADATLPQESDDALVEVGDDHASGPEWTELRDETKQRGYRAPWAPSTTAREPRPPSAQRTVADVGARVRELARKNGGRLDWNEVADRTRDR